MLQVAEDLRAKGWGARAVLQCQECLRLARPLVVMGRRGLFDQICEELDGKEYGVFESEELPLRNLLQEFGIVQVIQSRLAPARSGARRRGQTASLVER